MYHPTDRGSLRPKMAELEEKPQETDTARKRGRPKTHSDDERRAFIADVARRTFVDLGYAGTTTDIVATYCRISKQTLYRLFSTKSALFLAAVASHRQMMLALPRPEKEEGSLQDVLERIFMIDLDDEGYREREAFIHVVMRDSARVPELAEILRKEGIERSRDSLADWLKGQAAAGRLVLDDPQSGARMLMDMIFGGMRPGWLSREARRDHLRRCIRIFARGVSPT